MFKFVSAVALANCAWSFEFFTPSYWQQQQQCVKLLGLIPKGSSVLELDAVDGAKYMYYLPFGCEVTQRVENLEKEGPVTLAAQKLGMSVYFAEPEDELEDDYFDAAFSIGAVKRAGAKGGTDAAIQLLDEALRCLAPNGKLYFIEAGADECEPLLAAALDKSPYVRTCTASVDNGAIVGVVTKKTIPRAEMDTSGRGMGTSPPPNEKKSP